MIGLVVVGVILYGALWRDHSVLPNPGGAAEWRSAPTVVRRLSTKRGAPVLIPAVILQITGIVMAGVGVLAASDALPYPLSAAGYYLIVALWVLSLVSIVFVELRSRVRCDKRL